jgi:outer membrane protein assembly factor BamD
MNLEKKQYLCAIFFKGVRNLYFAVLLIFIVSCSGYERVLKSTDYQLKYDKMKIYYAKERYSKAITLLEQLLPIYRATQRADTVNLYYAYCNYYMGDYLMGAHYFKNYASVFGNSPHVEEAEFMSAYCYYLSSPKAELDQSDTYSAIQEFKLILIRRPNTQYKADCLKYIQELEEKLAEKDYLSAKLYYKMGKYKSAVVALNNCLREYPNSKFRENTMFLILKSSYFLASNSIVEKRIERFQNTQDNYYSFISEYPESVYRNEADKIFANASKYAENKTGGETIKVKKGKIKKGFKETKIKTKTSNVKKSKREVREQNEDK